MGESDRKTQASSSVDKKKWNKKKYHGAKPTAAAPVRTVKFQGGKDELGGNYFDCTGYGQSDRFVKTAQKIADYVGQDYKFGGVTRTEVLTQTAVMIQVPPRPVGRSTTSKDDVVTVGPPDALDISDYQSAKKAFDSRILNQNENRQKLFSLVYQQCTESMHAKNQGASGISYH
jgi:hypothetical protein